MEAAKGRYIVARLGRAKICWEGPQALLACLDLHAGPGATKKRKDRWKGVERWETLIVNGQFNGHGHVYFDGTLSEEAGDDGLHPRDGSRRMLGHLMAEETEMPVIVLSAVDADSSKED